MPGEIHLSARESVVEVESSGRIWLQIDCSTFDNRDAQGKANLRVALLSVLSQVQDFVAEELRKPWPNAGHGANSACYPYRT